MSAALSAPLLMLAVAAFCDARWRVIPNGLNAALALGGLAWALATLGLSGAAGAALAALAVFAGGAALFSLGVMGGGDVKLAAGLTLWLAPAQIAPFLIVTSLAGGALGLSFALWRMGGALAAGVPAKDAWSSAMRAPAPYGVAIAAGGALVLTAGA